MECLWIVVRRWWAVRIRPGEVRSGREGKGERWRERWPVGVGAGGGEDDGDLDSAG